MQVNISNKIYIKTMMSLVVQKFHVMCMLRYVMCNFHSFLRQKIAKISVELFRLTIGLRHSATDKL